MFLIVRPFFHLAVFADKQSPSLIFMGTALEPLEGNSRSDRISSYLSYLSFFLHRIPFDAKEKGERWKNCSRLKSSMLKDYQGYFIEKSNIKSIKKFQHIKVLIHSMTAPTLDKKIKALVDKTFKNWNVLIKIWGKNWLVTWHKILFIQKDSLVNKNGTDNLRLTFWDPRKYL